MQSSGDHAGVVQDQHIARAKKFQCVAKLMMLDASAIAMQNHQPRLIPLRHRMLGNQFGRQMEVEIGGSHVGESVIAGGQLPNGNNCSWIEHFIELRATVNNF